ncbi:hypothetical protein KS527_004463 [Salmonella enterica]|nr:hypothetical protein [Salmonella enterica]
MTSIIIAVLISWAVFSVIGVALCWALHGHKAFSFVTAFLVVVAYWGLQWAYGAHHVAVTYHLGSM